MFKNYIKLTIRNLFRHRINAIVNILGLAIGMALFLLMILFTRNEFSMDKFHDNLDKIYRVEAIDFSSAVSAKVGDFLHHDFPEIEKFARVVYMNSAPVAYQPEHSDQRNKFNISDFVVADTSFFDIFSFPSDQGNIKELLSEPMTIAITKSTAKKIFGDENPIGKTITVFLDQGVFRVVALLDDTPQTSSLKINMVVSMETYKVLRGPDILENLSNWFYNTYFIINPNVDIKDLENRISKRLREFTIEYYNIENPDYETFKLRLRPLTDLYFDTDYYTAECHMHGNKQMVRIVLIIAIFTLLIAIVNFINLSTSQGLIRAKEMGIRKVVGAHKKQLVFQLIGESVILSIISLNIAILIIELLKPLCNNLLQMDMKIGYVDHPSLIIILLLGAIFIGILAGIYPAIYLTSFKPVSILKGNILFGSFNNKSRFHKLTRGLQRKMLIVFQFSISAILIIGTLMVGQQMRYLKQHDLGFNKEHVIYFKLDRSMFPQKEAFRNEISEIKGVKRVSYSNFYPGRMNENSFIRTMNENRIHAHYIMTDPEFIDVMGIELKDGRNFSSDREADKNFTFLINEKAVEAFQLEKPYDYSMTLFSDDREGELIGVVKDFNFESLHAEITPLVIAFMPDWSDVVFIKVDGSYTRNVINELQKTWGNFASLAPFEYNFLDEGMNQLYKSDEMFGKIFLYFSVMAIAIACMGLFALIAFITSQKTKEIGIRKVMGASASKIVALFSRELIVLIFIAFLIAAPISYKLIQIWFRTFAYHTSIQWWVFIVALIAVMLIALLTSGWHTIKSSKANPANSLRYE